MARSVALTNKTRKKDVAGARLVTHLPSIDHAPRALFTLQAILTSEAIVWKLISVQDNNNVSDKDSQSNCIGNSSAAQKEAH